MTGEKVGERMKEFVIMVHGGTSMAKARSIARTIGIVKSVRRSEVIGAGRIETRFQSCPPESGGGVLLYSSLAILAALVRREFAAAAGDFLGDLEQHLAESVVVFLAALKHGAAAHHVRDVALVHGVGHGSVVVVEHAHHDGAGPVGAGVLRQVVGPRIPPRLLCVSSAIVASVVKNT